ncbi:MAG: RecB family exonuclease, partial [Actinomycetota bacterium]
MVHRVPVALSPSSLGTFTKCPLAFRFSYIERLPEPPSPAASKGTLVHLALQHLMWRPAAERTREAALDDLSRARAELASDPDLTGLELTDAEWDRFHADAEALLHRYFELEDPATIRAIGLELRVHAEVAPGVRMRGVIDRLELDDDGELVVTDYKTGRDPRKEQEQERMAGVHIYSLMVEKVFGKRPAKVQLIYLGRDAKVISTTTSAQTVAGVEKKVGADVDPAPGHGAGQREPDRGPPQVGREER